MKTVFIEHVGIGEFLPGGLCSKGDAYYFDISPLASAFIRIAGLSGRVRKFEFNLGRLHDAGGESYLSRIFGADLIALCKNIEDNVLSKDPLVNLMGRIYGGDKTAICFRKIIESETNPKLIFINVVKWYCESGGMDAGNAVFYIERNMFSEELRKLSEEKYAIRVVPRFSVSARVGDAIFVLKRVISVTAFLTQAGFYGAKKRFFRTSGPGGGKAKVGLPYRYYGVTFTLEDRCDFPWLLFSGIDLNRALLYFQKRHRRKPGATDLKNLRDNGRIQCVSTYRISKDIRVWTPGLRSGIEMIKGIVAIVIHTLRGLLSLKTPSALILAKSLSFMERYSRAIEFYNEEDIKISVDRDDTDPFLIAEEIALERAGGISVTYQQSNWLLPRVAYGSCADIAFLFGPYYGQVFEKGGSVNKSVIFNGLLHDYSFKRIEGRAAEARRRVTDNGAKFVIAYFGENSFNDRMSIWTDEDTARIYSKILEKLLADPEIGVIFSPKEPETIFRKLSSISGLIEMAESTGRCLFMKGTVRTEGWPCEAAMASDIAIGSFEGGTTVLESLLSGSRAVYLDTLGLYSRPEYEKGKDTIVFDSIEKILDAIDGYRRKREGCMALGDARVIDDIIRIKDPFRDGRAAERMGKYIAWLLDGFDAGISREDAITGANRRYAEAWGREKIITSLV